MKGNIDRAATERQSLDDGRPYRKLAPLLGRAVSTGGNGRRAFFFLRGEKKSADEAIH
jgi:hypothetical protein